MLIFTYLFLSIYSTGEKKNEVGGLEIYCVGLLTLLRGTLDWIESTMLSPIDENNYRISLLYQLDCHTLCC